MKKIIEEIVITLLHKAFFYTLEDKKNISGVDSFESLGLSHTDISIFIVDFFIEEDVVFFVPGNPVFIGKSIGDMVDFIESSHYATGGSELSGKISFGLLLHDIKTKKRGKYGIAL